MLEEQPKIIELTCKPIPSMSNDVLAEIKFDNGINEILQMPKEQYDRLKASVVTK